MPLSKIEDAFSFQRKLLTICGVWSLDHPTAFKSFLQRLMFLLIGLGFPISMAIVAAIMFVVAAETEVKIVSVHLVCLHAVYLTKVSTFYFRKEALGRILQITQRKMFREYPEDLDRFMKKSIRTSRRLVNMFQALLMLSFVGYIVTPILKTEVKHPMPQAFPDFLVHFIEQVPFPVYILLYFFMCCFTVLSTYLNICVDTLFTGFCSLATGHLQILRGKILRCTSGECTENDDKEVAEKLRDCAEHHQLILEFAEELESLYSYVCLGQYLGSIFSICLCSVDLAIKPGQNTSSELRDAGLILCLLYQIGIYCSYGNQVTEESSKIMEACYSTDWPSCGRPMATSIMLMIQRSIRPIYFTAGKFVVMSNTTLSQIVQTGFSYATVVKQLIKGK